ncbi:MAG TPA: DUF1080 domain-containing protein [Phenylobacterium sp.]|jgi:hypothetical protein|uniref:3-keto-disaccharide hydrolase n=1 Tax=Phenylobacterium sp. TaxID=1871053 RepID=UPI002BB50D42|nr:DUF1080 domain-containing protein [Phenylobacterium sp.]HXA37424.1 DUF1080 domain-containing protein [Phenylobacterium sp.]
MKALALGLAAAVLAMAAAPALAADNTLTPAEQAAGWKLLFDGKSTTGWKGFKTAAPDAGWTVRDGVIGPDPKTSKDLVSKEDFENFELDFDWKISPKGNSGVMIHVIPVGEETYESGPEYQILDNAHGEAPPQQAGSLFALYAPSMDMTKPVGQFNHGRIVVDHGRVQHWLNGMKVVEYDMNSADFKARVAASKFKRWPQFATGKTGAIALQNHGDAVWFKNIKIKVLK